jgi:hypothetical protein
MGEYKTSESSGGAGREIFSLAEFEDDSEAFNST